MGDSPVPVLMRQGVVFGGHDEEAEEEVSGAAPSGAGPADPSDGEEAAWVEDPYMVLVLTLDGARHRPSSGFWASDLDLHPPVAELRRLAKFKAELVFWSDLAAEADCPISFEMVQGRGGYWVAL